MIAVLAQSGPCMAAFTSDVTHSWPRRIPFGACSLVTAFGTIHDTAGNVPDAACGKKDALSWMLPSVPSAATSVKYGSGLNSDGVRKSCGTSGQVPSSMLQSGCAPGET